MGVQVAGYAALSNLCYGTDAAARKQGAVEAGALEAAIQSECFSLLGLEVRRDRAPKGYAVRQLETVFYPPRK